MRPLLSARSSSLSLPLRLLTFAIASRVEVKQRCRRVWLRLINRLGIPTPSLYGHLTDYEWDLEIDFPEFWADYLHEPAVINSISAHLHRCYILPPAKPHGH